MLKEFKILSFRKSKPTNCYAIFFKTKYLPQKF